MSVTPYIFFRGQCVQALDFYKKAVNADVKSVVRFGDVPNAPPGMADAVMHSIMEIGGSLVFASDGRGDDGTDCRGISLSLQAADDGEAERLFAGLADGGAVEYPLMSTPFASRFGKVTDRFGVSWLVVAMHGGSAN